MKNVRVINNMVFMVNKFIIFNAGGLIMVSETIKFRLNGTTLAEYLLMIQQFTEFLSYNLRVGGRADMARTFPLDSNGSIDKTISLYCGDFFS
jgi:hypothetical protein